MSINKYNIIKWYKMMSGKSILHVEQGIGRMYSKEDITGYYNDLTQKVLMDKNIKKNEIPKSKLENGRTVTFPIAVFQYGLGSYDLYLIQKKELYLNKFKLMSDWALDNQEENGAWNNFFYVYPKEPYSAMAQGEGASLLIRAYKEFEDEKYLNAAKKAIEFMLTPVKYGGTTLYVNEDIFFQEYTNKDTVLNGWIFALFGLYDYVKITDDKVLKEIFYKSLNSMSLHLGRFDNGYWSMYSTDGMITSPFYHNLHIAQLYVLYDLFKIESFKKYLDRWVYYRERWFNKTYAFIVKINQKLREK